MSARAFMVASILALAPLHAQTFIVDAAGGPGSHFKDLAKAVNSVPDGAVLRVRKGTYVPSVSFANKSLSIIGDGLDVILRGKVSIGPLRARDRVVLATLTIAPWSSSSPYLTATRLEGSILLHAVDCRAGSVPGASVPPPYDFTDCRNVQISQSRITGARFVGCSVQASHTDFEGADSGVTFGGGSVTTAGVGLEQSAGVVSLYACKVEGGRGNPVTHCGFPRDILGTPGADALTVAGGGELVLLRCTVRGGNGSSAAAPCSPAKDGGHGLVVAGSKATVLGSTLAGGAGGLGGGNSGLALVRDGQSSVVVDATRTTPLARIEGQVAPGQRIDLTVEAKPGSVALLLLGLDSTILPLSPIGFGHLYCIPALMLGQFIVPGNGALKLPLTVPAGIGRDVPVFGQYLLLEPSPPLLIGTNPVVLLVRS